VWVVIIECFTINTSSLNCFNCQLLNCTNIYLINISESFQYMSFQGIFSEKGTVEIHSPIWMDFAHVEPKKYFFTCSIFTGQNIFNEYFRNYGGVKKYFIQSFKLLYSLNNDIYVFFLNVKYFNLLLFPKIILILKS